MLAQNLWRDNHAIPALVLFALDRVNTVRHPHTVCKSQHSQVDAATAGAAGFDLQARVVLFQALEDGIHGARLFMHSRSARIGRNRLGDELIVVPLDVIDVKFTDQSIHGREHMLIGCRICQVDDLLVAPLHWQARNRAALLFNTGVQNPIRVCAGSIRIWVDHFWLKPQAELHSLFMHMLSQSCEGMIAFRPHSRVNRPISQPSIICTPVHEPAVVHDEAFHTCPSCFISQSSQRLIGVIEVHSFPRIEEHRALDLGKLRMSCAYKLVETLAGLVQTISIRAVQPWSCVRITWLE